MLLILKLLKTKIGHKGLFLNADVDFDSQNFRKFLAEKEIMGNITKNPRKGENSNEDFFLFDGKLYKNHFKIEQSFVWLYVFKLLKIRCETLNTT